MSYRADYSAVLRHGPTLALLGAMAFGSTSLFDPGVALPAHTHDHEEVLHILRGPVLAHVDGSAMRLQAGDAVIIPAGALHQISNDAAAVVEGLAVVPAGTHFILGDGTDNGVPPWVQ